jgi:hypothetical protein
MPVELRHEGLLHPEHSIGVQVPAPGGTAKDLVPDSGRTARLWPQAFPCGRRCTTQSLPHPGSNPGPDRISPRMGQASAPFPKNTRSAHVRDSQRDDSSRRTSVQSRQSESLQRGCGRISRTPCGHVSRIASPRIKRRVTTESLAPIRRSHLRRCPTRNVPRRERELERCFPIKNRESVNFNGAIKDVLRHMA